MNKGLKAYLKMGLANSKKLIKYGKTSIFKYYFMVMCSFLSSLFVLPAPIFIQANIRMDKQNDEALTYEITKVFSDNEKIEEFWLNLMCFLIKIILFVSGTLLLGGLVAILYFIGLLIGSITNVTLIAILFAIPAIIGLIIFICGFRLILTPLFYYLNNDATLSISKAYNASIRTMKEQGKLTLFMIDFLYILFIVIYLGITAFITFFLLNQNITSLTIIGYVVAIVLVTIFILVLPRYGIAHRIAKLNLMKDIMIDPYVAENPSLVKEKMIKQGLTKDKFLVKLFDKNVQEENEEVIEENKEETTEQAKEENK